MPTTGAHRPAAAQPPLRPIVGTALLIRRVEEELLRLFADGELSGTVHCCIGQELVGAVLGEHLRPDDSVFSNHRCHGHFLGVTGDVVGLVAEVMGRDSGVNGGRGGSQHLHRGRFYSGGVLGGLVPVAAGAALAHLLDGASGAPQDASPAIAVACVGDGTFGEGVVYETLNLAAVWGLPLLVVVEDNRVAQSTPARDVHAGRIEDRAAAFGMPVLTADTWDVDRLTEVAGHAVARVRAGSGPLVLLVDTYRLAPHSKSDDHRDPAEIAEQRARDELDRLLGGGDRDALELDREARQRVERAVTTARAAAAPAPEDLRVPERAAGGATPPAATSAAPRWRPATPDGRRVVAALREGFAELMAADAGLLVLGEDVRDPYGGAFKATAGLSTRFPDRVRNTPISEAAIVGAGAGLALGGYRAVVEIMFGDFVTLAMDQLVNHAAKLRTLYGLTAPGQLVVRTPMGGHRGYGPTHSQTLDRHLLGVPGLRIVALNSAVDPQEVYRTLLYDGGDPAVVLENKLLYGRRLGDGVPDGFDVTVTDGPLPVVRLEPRAAPDVTLVGYGGLLPELLDAADELFVAHDVVAQVLCPSQLYPFAVRPLLPVLDAAPGLVVVEEGQGFAGFGAELLAQLAEQAPRALAHSRRVAAAPVPIPAARALERAALPSSEDVVKAAIEVTDGH